MEKLWIYIAIFAFGNLTGVIIGVKLMGDQIEINIKKVKNKRTSGDNSVTVPIDVDKIKKTWKQRRLDKLNNK